MIFDNARRLALALPGVKEGTSYGTAAFRVKGKLFARLHDDGESLILRATPEQRAHLLARDPKVFHLTDHYRAHPWVLLRLGAAKKTALSQALEDAWRLRAPAKLVDAYDSQG